MKDNIKVLELDKYEHGIIINALNEYRNQLIRDGKDPEIINELLLKVLDAPDKKRMFHRKSLDER